MAADGGLRQLFEKTLPENPTLLEALSAWNRVGHPKRAVDPASFTEIFGELHFQEKLPDYVATALIWAAILPPTPPLSLPPPPPPPRAATASTWLDIAEKSKDDSSLDALLRAPKPAAAVKRSASFCVKKSPSASSLLLCTKGLDSESTVDVVRDDDDEDGLAAALRHKEELYVADAGAACPPPCTRGRALPPRSRRGLRTREESGDSYVRFRISTGQLKMRATGSRQIEY